MRASLSPSGSTVCAQQDGAHKPASAGRSMLRPYNEKLYSFKMKVIFMKNIVLFTLLLFFCACRTAETAAPSDCFASGTLSVTEKKIADSVLTLALDNEALYTLYGALKPMSNIHTFSLRVGTDSLANEQTALNQTALSDSLRQDLQAVERIERVFQKLNCSRFQFIVIPFRAVYEGKRYTELSVVHRGLFEQLTRHTAAFWGNWGIGLASSPATAVTAVENESRYNRYRGYGYLFGYPSHAVDFFVAAAKQQDADSAKKIVPRDFFHVPVYSGERGRFVYAVPKGYTPSPIDSAIYNRASAILLEYKKRRPRFLNKDGSLRATELLYEWHQEIRAVAPKP
jgi:hypothetical protein